MPDVVQLAVGIVAVAGAFEALRRWVWKPLMKLLREIREFLVDWNGTDARPGKSREPGVMERLRSLDRHVGNGTSEPLHERVGHIENSLDELQRRERS